MDWKPTTPPVQKRSFEAANAESSTAQSFTNRVNTANPFKATRRAPVTGPLFLNHRVGAQVKSFGPAAGHYTAPAQSLPATYMSGALPNQGHIASSSATYMSGTLHNHSHIASSSAIYMPGALSNQGHIASASATYMSGTPHNHSHITSSPAIYMSGALHDQDHVSDSPVVTPTVPGHFHTYTDHVYDIPGALPTSPAYYMSGALLNPQQQEPTVMHRIAGYIYNVTLWTGMCLATGLSYPQRMIRSSRERASKAASETYRVAVQTVNSFKRRAVEIRAARRVPTSQEERREILRASHRPSRHTPHRPSSASRPMMTSHTIATSPSPPSTPTSTVESTEMLYRGSPATDNSPSPSDNNPSPSDTSSILSDPPEHLDEPSPSLLRTPKTARFYESPRTGGPVSRIKKFYVGERMDMSFMSSSDITSTTQTRGTNQLSEAVVSESPIENHLERMNLRCPGDSPEITTITNPTTTTAKTTTTTPDEATTKEAIETPTHNNKNNNNHHSEGPVTPPTSSPTAASNKRAKKARDTSARKLKVVRLKLAAAKKEAEKKAREEAERLRTAVRVVPSDKVIKPLSEEWERRVDAAMAAGDGANLATTSTGTTLKRRDFGTVLPVAGRDRAGGWLNDEIVTGYLQAVVDRGLEMTDSAGRGKTPKYYAFSTFFYSSIREKGVASVRRWAGRGKIGGKALLDVERVFVPVHEHLHWTVLVVSPMARTIEYFDSLNGESKDHVARVRAWLAQELGEAYVEGEWTVVNSPSPQQLNGLDCGVFAVTTAKMIMMGVDPRAYGPEDIPLQRRRMVAELLNGGFVGEFAL